MGAACSSTLQEEHESEEEKQRQRLPPLPKHMDNTESSSRQDDASSHRDKVHRLLDQALDAHEEKQDMNEINTRLLLEKLGERLLEAEANGTITSTTKVVALQEDTVDEEELLLVRSGLPSPLTSPIHESEDECEEMEEEEEEEEEHPTGDGAATATPSTTPAKEMDIKKEQDRKMVAPTPPLLARAKSVETKELIEPADMVITLDPTTNHPAMKRRSTALMDGTKNQKSPRSLSGRAIRESIRRESNFSIMTPRISWQVADLSEETDDSLDGAPISRARQILWENVPHENDGFLSPENGFMPSVAPLQNFTTRDKALKKWDQLAEATRGTLLLTPTKFRSRVDAMPRFPVDILSDTELLRASSLLGTILQTYWYCGAYRQKPREDLLNAWGNVRRRLNWHVVDEDGKKYYDLPFYTLFDYSTCNWRQKDISGVYDVKDLSFDNLELNVLGMPPVDNSERFFYTGMLLMMARGANLPLLCVEAQEAAAQKDDDALAKALINISITWESITDSFSRLNLHHGAGDKMTDSVVFSRLFADTAIPMPFLRTAPNGKKIVTPSTGQSVPLFQLMDVFLNRKRYTGLHGEDVARHIAAYPRRWGNFIRAIQSPDDVSTTHIDMYIRQSGNRELQGLFSHCLQTYTGENGMIGRHLIKMYGYISMLFRTGRQATMGGYAGHPLDRMEDKIRKALQVSQRDRFAERPGGHLTHIARIYEPAVPLGRGSTPMWSVCLDVEGEGVRVCLGDHLRILPKNMCDIGDRLCQLVLNKLGLHPDIEVRVADMASWQESMNYFMGTDAPKTPTVALIALFGQIRAFTSEKGANIDITMEQLQNIKPLAPRLYSISIVQSDASGAARLLYLTVREWADGVASRMLVRGKPGTQVVCNIYQSRVLRRLAEGRTIYFASGTGLSPFTNFYADNSFPFDQWLVFTTQVLSEDMQSDFKYISRYNRRTTIDVLQTSRSNHESRARSATSTNFQTHEITAPRGHRLAAFFEKDGIQHEKLCNWSEDTHLTVLACGNIGFVMEVVKLLRSIGVNIEQWIATGRLRVECFGSPGWVPSSGQTLFAPWEVLRSALPEQDEPSLMVLGENVYRITQDMLDIHPGGRDLIQMYQGADATRAFEAVGHDKNGNATGMLQAFEVGRFHKNIVENPRFDSKEASFDVIRMAWDCAEMRNCHLIDDSLHERMSKRPGYRSTDTEIHGACALATHKRATDVHFPRLCKLVEASCEYYCPKTNWDNGVQQGAAPAVSGEEKIPVVWMGRTDKVDADKDASGKERVLENWQVVRKRDRKFMASCVAHAANLCEEVAGGGNNLEAILMAWRKELCDYISSA